jgi:phenylacetic acid degradation protein/carnitine operon protein CaiE
MVFCCSLRGRYSIPGNKTIFEKNGPYDLFIQRLYTGYSSLIFHSSPGGCYGQCYHCKNVYVGPGASIRGDWGGIVIEDGCNVQENCTIHMFPGVTVLLKEGAHIGHGAVIHGATIGRNCLVGMNSVIMDNVDLGDECIVGALSFIKADEKIPARSLLVGNPAKIIKQVLDDMIQWKTDGTRLYQALPGEMQAEWAPCEPLREVPADRPEQNALYKTWNDIRKG